LNLFGPARLKQAISDPWFPNPVLSQAGTFAAGIVLARAPMERVGRHQPIMRCGARAMRFSWTGLFLAPLLVPVIFAVIFISLQGSGSLAGLLLGFLILFIPGCVISYGTTIFLFLPSLFLLSLWRPMTGLKACLLGLVLGALVFVPLTLMDWASSGPDSGPPTESFPVFFVRWAADPFTALFPTAGLITAGSYWWLARSPVPPGKPD
jgi:hypothetical protein